MRLVNDPLLKWRQPTDQEKEWIMLIWGAEEKRKRFPFKGTTLRCIGIISIVLCVVSILSKPTEIANGIIGLLMAALCIFVSKAFNDLYKLHKQRLSVFEQGNYLVAEAYSTSIRRRQGGIHGHGIPWGLVDVPLPSGGCAKDLKMSEFCSEPLIHQNIQRVPLLLIQVQGDEETLTIPAKQQQ